MKLIIVLILLLSFHFSVASDSFGLNYQEPNYKFILPATSENKTINFFDDCDEHRGLSASAEDEGDFIYSIHKNGTKVIVPVDSESTNSN